MLMKRCHTFNGEQHMQVTIISNYTTPLHVIHLPISSKASICLKLYSVWICYRCW